METLVTILRRAAKLWPNGEALRLDATNEAISFAEFDHRTDMIAAGLLDAGLERGDRVVICTANTALFPLAWFGTIKAGGVTVPVNIGYRAEDTRHILEMAEPKVVFCDAERIKLLNEVRRSVASIQVLVTDAADIEVGWQALETFLLPPSDDKLLDGVSDLDITNIQFTSGTSGMPKGCMLSHEYWIELVRSVNAGVISLMPGDTMLTAQAFSYLDPQWAFVLTLMTGARLVVLERFRPAELWHKIAFYKVRFFYCLAAMPLMLLSRPVTPAEREHRLSVIMCSAIPSDRHHELEKRFGVPWLEAYGTTETGFDLGVSWADHARSIGTGTIGRPLSHREAVIVDELFLEVENSGIGDMLVRGKAMMKGYWRNPAATAAAFHNGWYRTGDMARKDCNGFYYLEGRRKDTIRRAGENIAANEVETVLQQHPAVILAACIPVPDPIRNEEIKAFIVCRDEVTVAELIGYLELRLARFKIPRYWAFAEALPMTASERIAKPQLSRDIGGDVYDTQGIVMRTSRS